MKHTHQWLLCMSLIVALAAPAAAQVGLRRMVRAPVRLTAARPNAARPNPQRQMLDQLGITPEQRRQLNQLRRGQHDEQTRLNTAIRDQRQELANMYRNYPLDAARAGALIDQIAQMEAQRMRLQLQIQAGLRQILTRDQFLRFSQMMQTSRQPSQPPLGRVPGS